MPINLTSARRAYKAQCCSAKKRGIEWRFTFETWLAVWNASGKWDLRGRGGGRYAMGRFGDVGPYSPENVEIVTNNQNSRDARLNAPPSLEARIKRFGTGRGWSLLKRGRRIRFQVMISKKYVGVFRTQEAAEAAYERAVFQARQMVHDGI